MKRALLLVTLAICFCAGCTSHNAANLPRLDQDRQARQDKVEDDGMVLMARPIHRKADLKTYFDKDLLQYEVLPIHLRICNESHGCPVVLNAASISLWNAKGDPIPVMNLEQVLEVAKKSYDNAAAMGFFLGVFGLIPAAINVSNTNEQIEADYESRFFKGGKLEPGAASEGVLFYKVPLELDSLEGWKLTLVAVDPMKKKTHTLEYLLTGVVEPRPPIKREIVDPALQTEGDRGNM